MPDWNLKWKAGAYTKMSGEFQALVDDAVHAVGSRTDSSGWYTMACYTKYTSTLLWSMELVNDPVTCMFCIAGVQKFH